MKTGFIITLILINTVLFAQKQTTFVVNFDFDKYDITPASAARLDSFAQTILTKPTTFTIELTGHCDSVGSNVYNDALSVKRTQAVKDYLAERGLPSFNVIKEEGFGKRKPLNKNATDYERYLNRRVVVDVSIPGKSVITFPVKKPVEKIVEKPVEKKPGEKIIIDKPVEKTITAIVADTATKVGSSFVLRNLVFIGGSHELVPESVPILKELLKVMTDNPKLEISIEGHVCCIPGKNDGIDLAVGTPNLSEMRAITVYNYLVIYGIAPGRLSYKGYGHQFPVAPYPERNVQEMDSNRRVEIKIIKK